MPAYIILSREEERHHTGYRGNRRKWLEPEGLERITQQE
jgi:hypothetical protein